MRALVVTQLTIRVIGEVARIPRWTLEVVERDRIRIGIRASTAVLIGIRTVRILVVDRGVDRTHLIAITTSTLTVDPEVAPTAPDPIVAGEVAGDGEIPIPVIQMMTIEDLALDPSPVVVVAGGPVIVTTEGGDLILAPTPEVDQDPTQGHVVAPTEPEVDRYQEVDMVESSNRVPIKSLLQFCQRKTQNLLERWLKNNLPKLSTLSN